MSLKRTIIVSAVMILTMFCVSYLSHVEEIEPNKPLSTFPKHIGEWTGKEERFDKIIYEVLGVDDSFLCNYTAPGGRQIQLYIGFYRSQREGDLIHSPKNCLPGSGWDIIHTSSEELILPEKNPSTVKAVKLILKKGDQKQTAVYWFHSRGRLITSEYMQKIYLVIDSIIRHRTDGSFIRLTAPFDHGKEPEYLKDFAHQLMPILQEYIPS